MHGAFQNQANYMPFSFNITIVVQFLKDSIFRGTHSLMLDNREHETSINLDNKTNWTYLFMAPRHARCHASRWWHIVIAKMPNCFLCTDSPHLCQCIMVDLTSPCNSMSPSWRLGRIVRQGWLIVTPSYTIHRTPGHALIPKLTSWH